MRGCCGLAESICTMDLQRGMISGRLKSSDNTGPVKALGVLALSSICFTLDLAGTIGAQLTDGSSSS